MYNKKGVSFSTRYKRKTDDFRGGVCHEKNKKIQTWQEEHPDPAGDGIYRDLCDSDPVDQYYFLLYQIASQWLAYVILLCYTISNVVLSKNFLSIQRIVSRNIAIT